MGGAARDGARLVGGAARDGARLMGGASRDGARLVGGASCVRAAFLRLGVIMPGAPLSVNSHQSRRLHEHLGSVRKSKGCSSCCDYPFMSHFDWKLRRPALLLQRGRKVKINHLDDLSAGSGLGGERAARTPGRRGSALLTALCLLRRWLLVSLPEVDAWGSGTWGWTVGGGAWGSREGRWAGFLPRAGPRCVWPAEVRLGARRGQRPSPVRAPLLPAGLRALPSPDREP